MMNFEQVERRITSLKQKSIGLSKIERKVS